eukprot:CAMPEP_0177407390 /NCGR_PEP_ID=MMETSP0368-20130122/63079_1 /TAXON_ID=447022 ORGANISM="Scrippsiella hangoei-like, Strain SHHI-4" /NCGR_SAMPLE_ID=MMETSP0368 /ASSEMBLY_ACC=CAM_ASM_000363 /LENGTH=84 /DNA_ID=CAMNT_0018875877 /DNA_START=41 /DNA_END=292 /DNA_ORIENTATION=+
MTVHCFFFFFVFPSAATASRSWVSSSSTLFLMAAPSSFCFGGALPLSCCSAKSKALFKSSLSRFDFDTSSLAAESSTCKLWAPL